MDGFIEPPICFSSFISLFFWCVRSIFPGFAFITYFPTPLVVNDLRRLDELYFFLFFFFLSVQHSSLFFI